MVYIYSRDGNCDSRDGGQAITHRITIDPLPDVSTAAVPLTYTGTAVEVDRRPPIVVGHPLAGARWAALGSGCDGPHRRAHRRPVVSGSALRDRLQSARSPPAQAILAANQLPHLRSAGVRGRGTELLVVAVDGNPDLKVGERREEPNGSR